MPVEREKACWFPARRYGWGWDGPPRWRWGDTDRDA